MNIGLKRGFTLLEVLVAMSILMLIVLMMSTLFHQSSMAWDNGLRQAQMSIQARSALSRIRNDLSQAVASADYPCKISASSIDIYVLDKLSEDEDDRRAVKHVVYSGKIDRHESEVALDGSDRNRRGGKFLDSVDSFKVDTSPNWDGSSDTLPEWVDVTITLSAKTAGAAGIKVWSNGRDRKFDTDDDKRRRLRTWR